MATPVLQIAGNKVCATMGRSLAKLTEFAHDYAGDYADIGGVVHVPVLSAVAGVFDESTNNYEQGSTINDASIVLSSQYVAGFNVSPKQMSDGMGAYNGLFNQLGEAAGRAIAASVEAAAVGQVLSTNVGATETLSATKSGFTQLPKVCASHNIAPENCVLVLNPESYGKLLDTCMTNDVIGQGKAYETGFVDNFLGFRRIISSFKVDAGLKGFIAEYGAIGIAGRRIPMLENYPFYEEYIDDATGIPTTLVGFQKFATGNYYITATTLFGTSIINKDAIIGLL